MNVTEVSVPNATENGEIMGPDSRLIGTTYDLRWPDKSLALNETVRALKAERNVSVNGPLCVFPFYRYVLPDIANRYTGGDSSSCEGVIPDRCLSIIMNTMKELVTCFMLLTLLCSCADFRSSSAIIIFPF